MRTLLFSTLLVLVSTMVVGAQEGPPGNAMKDERFQMLAVGNRAMLLDRKAGKSWLLAAKGDKAAWIPIETLDDSSVASAWLRANLGGGSGTKRARVSATEAARQVKLEEITQSEVAAEPFTVLVARERAELTRLKREYGDLHPEVVASRTRLLELLKVGDEGESER